MTSKQPVLARGDIFTDVEGRWQVLQVHPPQGKRQQFLYTVMHTTTSEAFQIEERELTRASNKMEMVHPD